MSDWQRGDYVRILRRDGKNRWEQLIVAADNPAINGKPWVVAADEDNWLNIGDLLATSYVEKREPVLLHRLDEAAHEVASVLVEELVTQEPTPDSVSAEVPARAAVLREAEGLITGDRNHAYGTPTQNFSNIAELWTTQFRHKFRDGERFTGTDVAVAQIHVKQARLIAQPKRDSFVDIAGYAACGWEVQEATQ